MEKVKYGEPCKILDGLKRCSNECEYYEDDYVPVCLKIGLPTFGSGDEKYRSVCVPHLIGKKGL